MSIFCTEAKATQPHLRGDCPVSWYELTRWRDVTLTSDSTRMAPDVIWMLEFTDLLALVVTGPLLYVIRNASCILQQRDIQTSLCLNLTLYNEQLMF